MPKTTEPKWKKVKEGFEKECWPFAVVVLNIDRCKWAVRWRVQGSGWLWVSYTEDAPSAAFAKSHATQLLNRLVAAIQFEHLPED